MNIEEKWNKMDELTHEADMLIKVLDDALNFNENSDEACAISYLSEIIREKLEGIRNLFYIS